MIGIIPAAGKGVRFKELGKNYPKAILPYNEKPILIHNVKWMFKQGCTEVRVVVNHQAFLINSVLDQFLTEDERSKVNCMSQPDTSGLSAAIDSAVIGNESSVLILLGDLMVKHNLGISDFQNSFISAEQVPDYSRWCMVKVDFNGSAIRFFDKPEERPSTNLAVSGVYHFKDPDNLKKLLTAQFANQEKISGEYQLSTVMAQIPNLKVIQGVSILDFGTLEEYLDNKESNRSREFNTVVFNKDTVNKQSVNRNKMLMETLWFENLPESLVLYTPRIVGKDIYHDSGRADYTMERIHATTLRELFLFLDSSDETWEKITEHLKSFVETCSDNVTNEKSFLRSMFYKTKDRISFARGLNLGGIKAYDKEVDELLTRLDKMTYLEPNNTIMHGDLCFSNIMYSLSADTIKVIDPRGEIYGSTYYDLAKLMHSVFYNYDFIDADLFSYDEETDEFIIYNNGKENIKEIFNRMFDYLLDPNERRLVVLLTASLFVSMLPLHQDQPIHQKLFVKMFLEALKDFKEL